MKTRRKSKSGRPKKTRTQTRQPRGKAPKFVIDVALPEPVAPPEPPRFVISSGPVTASTKAKYAELSRPEKLQVFLELACYVDEDDIGFEYIDVSHPDNRERAAEWWHENLSFLSDRDAEELRRVWDSAAANGMSARQLFTAVKCLQDKYQI